MDVTEWHPASTIFPMMDGVQLQNLAQDIRDRGLMDPIELYEGRVLDGRNRLRACELAGVEPRFVQATLNGATPTEYVVSKNLHRRHLSVPQRAALALEILPALATEAKERQRIAGSLYGEKHPKTELEEGESDPLAEKGKAAEKAARLVGVGTSTIEKTIQLSHRSPRTIAKMRDGEFETMAEARRAAGFVPNSHDALEKGRVAPAYGKGDKFREATEPLRRYLHGWKGRGYEFRHVNPKDAARRIRVIDGLVEELANARDDLSRRAHKATLSAPTDKRGKE